MKIVWATLDNSTGEKTLKQHAFIDVKRTAPFLGTKYNGSKSLCSKYGISDDDETFISVLDFESESMKDNACKRCIKIAKNINHSNH